MKRYDKLVLLIVALVLMSKLGAIGSDFMFSQTYGVGPIPMETKKTWEFISFLLSNLINFGVGIWLYIEARREKINRWVWAIFGVIFGLMGLVIYYLIRINTKIPEKSM
jgi:uncharacterized BrkB/YihY/UPF0761 family membrane protein